MSKKEYHRAKWRLEKVYDRQNDTFRYRVLRYSTYKIFFFTCHDWVYIDGQDMKACQYPWKENYQTVSYKEIVSFKSEQLAREFIEFFEKYRKKIFDVAKELENPYIDVN